MPETLVIRLPEDATHAAECILVDGNGAPVAGAETTPLEQAASLSEGRRVVGLVPASHVLRTRADIPLRNKARIQQALPFALEEQLAADLDNQHFAFSARDEGGRIPVAVVARRRVSEWLEQLTAAGIKPDAIFSESDGITTVPSTVTVLVDGERIIIRDADGGTTVADPESLQAILELMFDEPADVVTPAEADPAAADEADEDAAADPAKTDSDNTPVNILVYCNESDYERFAVLWEMLRLRVESLDVKILPDGALPRMASHIVTAGGVNLLQGGFAPKRELPVQWRQWKLPGLLVLGLLALLVLQSGLNLWQLSSEENDLDAAASQLLTSTFPDAGDANDPWAELRSRLGDTETVVEAAGPGFAEAVEALAAAFESTRDITLEGMSFRDGKLDLQLIAPSVERLDALRQGIVSSGKFSAEIQSANPDGDTIKGRIKISAAGGTN